MVWFKLMNEQEVWELSVHGVVWMEKGSGFLDRSKEFIFHCASLMNMCRCMYRFVCMCSLFDTWQYGLS